MYQGLNVGLVRIAIDTDGFVKGGMDSATPSGTAAVATAVFQVLDHNGDIVMTKAVPLRTPRALLGHSHSNSHSNDNIYNVGTGVTKETVSTPSTGTVDEDTVVSNVVCEPHWGPVPSWRMRLFQLIVFVWITSVVCAGVIFSVATALLPLSLLRSLLTSIKSFVRTTADDMCVSSSISAQKVEIVTVSNRSHGGRCSVSSSSRGSRIRATEDVTGRKHVQSRSRSGEHDNAISTQGLAESAPTSVSPRRSRSNRNVKSSGNSSCSGSGSGSGSGSEDSSPKERKNKKYEEVPADKKSTSVARRTRSSASASVS
jgi:hypothetical protein